MVGFLTFLTLPACLHQNQLRNPIHRRKMAGKMTTTFVMFALFAMLHFGYVQSNPAIATGYEPMEICIENCAQCKKMLGAWFEGPLCAESCIKFKGKLIPECEDFASIAPFLNKL